MARALVLAVLRQHMRAFKMAAAAAVQVLGARLLLALLLFGAAAVVGLLAQQPQEHHHLVEMVEQPVQQGPLEHSPVVAAAVRLLAIPALAALVKSS